MKPTNLTKHAKKMSIACGILAASLSFGASAFAFSDLKGNPAETKINALHNAGVINGITSDLFAPKAKVTTAQAIQFLVKGLALAPQPGTDSNASTASSFFENVKDNAWYASSFAIAQQSGLTLAKDIDPNAPMTRAEFAHLLTQALQSKGNFPVTKMFFMIEDGDKLSPEVNYSLQVLLNTKVLTLDNGKFRPADVITRSEAAVMIHDAADFAARVITPNNPVIEPSEPEPVPVNNYVSDVVLEKAAEGVNKATITVDNLPNPGYGLVVERIEFTSATKAVLYFKVTLPDPDKMYAQVITKGSVSTYLPAGYTATAEPVMGSRWLQPSTQTQ
ncbi:S-layer homology domain-containing protein [Paenibacillus tritici]|uniref:S-layer homology domain-containing protein n=1 Tax=Paenibacillus tritici TaxID=1873425 RepID=A0ABX2DWQ2_9BACL|nr:S-layer homology domain-containing protein [Paenibacillus tritici]NQX49153.1 S-layer homology domain-containing protein [Paenibacillus tritici]